MVWQIQHGTRVAGIEHGLKDDSFVLFEHNDKIGARDLPGGKCQPEGALRGYH